MVITTKNKLSYLQDTKTAIKNALIEKGQTVADSDTFRSYAAKINAIEVSAAPVLESLEVTENGNYTPSAGTDGFSSVSVQVPDIPAVVQPLEVTENGTYTAPDGVDGYSPVTVNVAGSGTSPDLRYVTFMSYDGLTEYGKKAVAVGDDCADPIARGVFSTPTRESDAQYNYTFYGWATTPNGAADANWNKAITEDKTAYANFASAVRYYTITYYDSDGTTVLKTESLAYGTVPSYAPEKDGYKFVAWEPELVEVTGDASYVSSWAEKLKLADYTWAQLGAMTLEEAKANFAVGDMKDYYVLVGFEQDKLTNGQKAKMTFIYCSAMCSMNGRGVNASMTYTTLGHYTYMFGDPSSRISKYSEISPVVKKVAKKYVSDRVNGTISTINQDFWFASASELGYIPDGTTIMDEGDAYEAFNNVSFGQKISTKYTPTVFNGFTIVSADWLRTLNAEGAIYLKSGVATQLKNDSTISSSSYATVGFCI